MSNIQQKLEQKKLGLDVRLTNVETNLNNLYDGSLKSFADADRKLSEHDEILTAVIELLGTQSVADKMKENKITRLEAESATRKAALDESLKNGQCKVADAVSAVSIIVGSEVDKDGNKLYPSRAQLLFPQLKKEYAELLINKKVGDVIETPSGGKFTINEVYDMVLPNPATIQQPVVVFDPADSPTPSEEIESTPVATDGSVN